MHIELSIPYNPNELGEFYVFADDFLPSVFLTKNLPIYGCFSIKNKLRGFDF